MRRSQTDPWADAEDHPRSSSQPRAVSREQSFPRSSGLGVAAANGGGGRRGSEAMSRAGGGGGGGGGGREPGSYSSGSSAGLASPPHLDIHGSRPSSTGVSGGGGSTGGGGGGSFNGYRHHLPEAFSVLDHHSAGLAPAAPGRRPSSLPLSAAGGGGGSRGHLAWELRNAGVSGRAGLPSSRGNSGRASPQMAEAAWLKEVERRRRDRGGRGGSVDGDRRGGGGGGGGGGGEMERMMQVEGAQRSVHHFDRRYMAEEQVREEEGEEEEETGGGGLSTMCIVSIGSCIIPVGYVLAVVINLFIVIGQRFFVFYRKNGFAEMYFMVFGLVIFGTFPEVFYAHV